MNLECVKLTTYLKTWGTKYKQKVQGLWETVRMEERVPERRGKSVHQDDVVQAEVLKQNAVEFVCQSGKNE